MKIAITGGGGFLGRRLAAMLLTRPEVGSVRLVDTSLIPEFEGDPRVERIRADLLAQGAADSVVAGADVVYHLAAVVSGQAEAEFDLGMGVNLDATRLLLEAARSGKRTPRFVFTSSLAVFGPPLPAVVDDGTAVHPRSSYGAQKAIGELLVSDYSRKGYVDGRAVRLPTVCVRPGKPNAAASGFVSGIIREPLNGLPAACPVPRGLELWLSSPKSAVANLVHAGLLPGEKLGDGRIINLPGITVSVGEMIESLARVAGPEAAARISFSEDETVRRIVSSWPARFDVTRALGLGFVRDPDFESLIQHYIETEMAPRRP